MKKYWALFKVQMQNFIAYRGSMLIWTFGGLFAVLTLSSLWQAADGDVIGGFKKTELISYYLVGYLFSWITSWAPFSNVQDDIRNGNFSNAALLKPMSYFWLNFMTELGWHLLSSFIALILIVIVILSFNINLVPFLGSFNTILTIISLVMATALSFCFCMAFGLFALFVLNIRSLFSILFWAGASLFGGQVIPLSFVPSRISSVLEFLPYRYLYSFPIETYLEKINFDQWIFGTLISILWTGVFIILYKLLWKFGIKRYAAFGH